MRDENEWLLDPHNLGNLEVEEFGDVEANEWDFRRIEEEIKCQF